jgi:transcription elongation factor GreA
MTEVGDVVQIGSRVCVRDKDGDAQFRIVEQHEADAVAERVSAESPLGRALLGRRVGDLVRFRAPSGVLSVTVVDVV